MLKSNMARIFLSNSRGLATHGWLKSYHTFSFAHYHNPNMMNFRALRVINEDWISPSQGFATHSHADMEIITYVISGTLSHKDSMGNVKTLKAGQVQTMSAGSGITHSEFNASPDEECHLYQMWILPAKKGITPRYHEWHPPAQLESGKLHLIASPNGADGSAVIERDVKLYLSELTEGAELTLPLNPERYGWLQVATGEVVFGDEILKAGDAVSFSKEQPPKITAKAKAQILFYDLD
jgi:redox-sensitive bicupin YhaK (pirin superfamily)